MPFGGKLDLSFSDRLFPSRLSGVVRTLLCCSGCRVYSGMDAAKPLNPFIGSFLCCLKVQAPVVVIEGASTSKNKQV